MLNVTFMDQLKLNMKAFSIKNTDSKKGQLVCSDANIEKVQFNFKNFQAEIFV